MKKEVIFVILNEFAEWEGSFLGTSLRAGVKPGNPIKYAVKTMSVTKEPLMSITGFRVMADYDINSFPQDYTALILIGGMSWFTEEAKQLVPIVEKAIREGKIVGGICNASVFLGCHGFLNNVKHTSNTVEYLKQYAGDNYTNEAGYIERQAVADKNIVTANGTGYLEFMKEVLLLLDADTPEIIDEAYRFYKYGLYPVTEK
ncbi:type 1 glutamine amidotransferase family protein [Dysgonomonas sp. 25]|uniref:type 1 glutamine amidotransferase family protein n=1 Tax=Dysgonomonas sp. 25 TaxID=2302933 RepID=UPI0013D094D8|nr:type 1 glutamine amidotransferase family protein [Dysgonomonas sp. 25]NDV67434.1 glutamine amidotransferase [Dysgonomonas sp. 25]